MSQATHGPTQPDRSQLIRRSRLFEKVPFSKSTLYAKMLNGGRYHDPTFPRPIYSPNSRTPFWREAEVDDWITAFECRSQQPTSPDLCSGISVPNMAASTEAPAELHETAFNVPSMESNTSICILTVVGTNGGKRQIRVAVRNKRQNGFK